MVAQDGGVAYALSVTTALATSLISAAGALLVAVAGYIFAKRKDREAEWRKEKLAYYKEFVSSLSGILENESSPQEQVRFAKASNDILLFAPYHVIEALMAFQNEIGARNPSRSRERHDQLLSALFFEMRRDIGVKPRDKRRGFAVRLWASGAAIARREPGA